MARPTTPGKQIPSHGTNRLGSRYAYDFLQVDWQRKGLPSWRGSLLRYLILGIPLSQCYCWGHEVFAPCDGAVVQAQDGWAERARMHVVSDSIVAIKSAHAFDPRKDDVRSIAGNHIIIQHKTGFFAALVHLQTGSLSVSAGNQIKKGDLLGRVGHSGNSYTPHLHFQLTDSSDITCSNGLPCAFERYEVLREGTWETVQHGIPTDKERIRS